MLTTGESGIRPITKGEYFKNCVPDVIAGIFCTYFGVPEPKLEKITTRLKWRGAYYIKAETVKYSHEYTGLIMHELAHHIVCKLGKNGYRHHGPEFWAILQEMHDYWR